MTEYNFDPIRPYYKEELSPALQRIVQDELFNHLLNYLFPDELHDELKSKILKSKDTHEFQTSFMLPVINSILKKTADEITVSGIENLSKDKGYVFIANHRDIILDSSILAVHLVNHGFETCKITWGDNLMISPFVIDVGKANRMITVFREGSPKEILKNSQLLSAYIRETTTEKKQTVWIAQRKGRSKDGTDTTDSGVLKMLSLTGDKDPIESLKKLNITPVSISYEWEPCDTMKVRELFLSSDHEYVKEENEDLRSIIGGVVTNKGRIHISVGEPINALLDTVDKNLRPNERIHQVANIIDKQIHTNYKLWPSNFIANEMLTNGGIQSEKYDASTLELFNQRLQSALDISDTKKKEVRDLFLKLYANPVSNK